MNKIFVIIQREYRTRVAKRSFLLLTILVPILIFGFYAIMIMIAMSGGSENEKIAVIDNAGIFPGKPYSENGISFNVIGNETQDDYLGKYRSNGYTSLLYIPENYTKDTIRIFSDKQMGLVTKGKVESIINNTIQQTRMKAMNITPEQMEKIRSNVTIDARKWTG